MRTFKTNTFGSSHVYTALLTTVFMLCTTSRTHLFFNWTFVHFDPFADFTHPISVPMDSLFNSHSHSASELHRGFLHKFERWNVLALGIINLCLLCLEEFSFGKFFKPSVLVDSVIGPLGADSMSPLSTDPLLWGWELRPPASFPSLPWGVEHLFS